MAELQAWEKVDRSCPLALGQRYWFGLLYPRHRLSNHLWLECSVCSALIWQQDHTENMMIDNLVLLTRNNIHIFHLRLCSAICFALFFYFLFFLMGNNSQSMFQCSLCNSHSKRNKKRVLQWCEDVKFPIIHQLSIHLSLQGFLCSWGQKTFYYFNVNFTTTFLWRPAS